MDKLPICKFCSQETPYRPLQEMEEHGIKVYFCTPCRAEYVFWTSGVICSSSLYAVINSETYRWTTHVNGEKGILWHVKTPGIPGTRANKDLELIKEIAAQKGEELPQLTPQNIEVRIKTWLLMI